jgi:hypothetical protein
MKKSMYHFRGFTGPDVSIDTCLREYGLAWKQTKKDEYLFIHGVACDDGEFTNFTYTHLSKTDFLGMCHDSWFDLNGFLTFIGQPIVEPENWIDYVQSAVQYHGYENIFGSCYSAGFQIT